MAGSRVVGGAFREAIAAAERALALAAELGLPEPARALGMRGAARASLGERQGLEDMRQALALALEQGQGRAAAVLYNNLAVASWQYEGPQVALDTCREGIDFCERRGIAEFALAIAAMSTTFLAESGRAEQALAEAGPVAERLQAATDVDYIEPRSVQLRLLCERGAHEQAPAADELLATARESGQPQVYALAFTAAARLLLAQGQRQQASALLDELAQVPEHPRRPLLRRAPCPRSCARHSPSGSPSSPSCSWTVSSRARRSSSTPSAPAAPSSPRPPATTPRLSALYAEAAERWREFGNVPERAYALLGQGRCLAALGQPEAQEPLREARELFASMGYKPALAETDALLERTTAAAS